MFFDEKLSHNLGIKRFWFQVDVSHETNLTKFKALKECSGQYSVLI